MIMIKNLYGKYLEKGELKMNHYQELEEQYLKWEKSMLAESVPDSYIYKAAFHLVLKIVLKILYILSQEK